MTKVRIIKTDFGYTPQAYFDFYGDKSWHSLGGSSHVTNWDTYDQILRCCIYKTQWGAKKALNKWIKANVLKESKLTKLKVQLENPNVIYEAEV